MQRDSPNLAAAFFPLLTTSSISRKKLILEEREGEEKRKQNSFQNFLPFLADPPFPSSFSSYSTDLPRRIGDNENADLFLFFPLQIVKYLNARVSFQVSCTVMENSSHRAIQDVSFINSPASAQSSGRFHLDDNRVEAAGGVRPISGRKNYLLGGSGGEGNALRPSNGRVFEKSMGQGGGRLYGLQA